MSLLAARIVSPGVPRRMKATTSTRSATVRRAWRKLIATRTNKPIVNSENPIEATDSAESSGVRRKVRKAS